MRGIVHALDKVTFSSGEDNLFTVNEKGDLDTKFTIDVERLKK